MRRFNKSCTTSAGSIGIIGGSDGPTAIFCTSRREKREREYQEFLMRAQQALKPCRRSFSQLEEYLISTYQAQPCQLSAGELETIKVNVLLNYRPELLEETPLPNGCGETSFEALFLRAHAYPMEKLGLQPKAYLFPTVFPDPPQPKRRLWRKKPIPGRKPSPAVVIWEETSSYLCMNHGNDSVMSEMVLFLGIDQKDIAGKSPRFVCYAMACRKKGLLC